jgi:hypothetical protein
MNFEQNSFAQAGPQHIFLINITGYANGPGNSETAFSQQRQGISFATHAVTISGLDFFSR